ncbi:MAG TPA: penicillin-binding protein 2 [Gemmatimonadales bacterium]|nr:penicillin-binding protein 2 [Gemmatimonadales bacterium]
MSEFHSHRLERRATQARAVLALAFVVLLGAFFRAQVVEHERFRLRAESNRLRELPLAAPRGALLDRHGEVIADNIPGYTVRILAVSADSLGAVLDRLAALVPVDSTDRARALERFRRTPYQPALVFADASFETVSRLEEHRPVLTGLVIQAEPKRHYPDAQAVAHLVGYVGEVTERELDQKRFPGARLGTIVGRLGLEQEYDSVLRGRAGVRYVEINARGRLVREDGATALAPEAGQPLQTTVDLPLQRYVDSLWRADAPGVRGALVALTPAGEVLALYSAPSYDPNLFIGGISADAWRQLTTDSARPMMNRAIQAMYNPASPFKLAIAAMGMKRGLVNLRTRMPIACAGGIQVGNRYFRCWKREGHGSLDLEGAVAQSCNVYFYQLGMRLGINALFEEGGSMGFSDRSGIDLENEIQPIYPTTTAYYDRRYGPRGWSARSVELNFSIGQGENTQSLINMAAFYQALSAGGKVGPPYLVRPRDAHVRDLGLTDEQLEGLRLAMVQVVQRGTARASAQQEFQLAGKTGTAQNPFGKDHGWFLGFGPADEPKIIVGAIMEFAEHGSSVAPYVARVVRRFLVGPEPPEETRPIRLPGIEVDSAPRVLELGPTPRPVEPPARESVLTVVLPPPIP